MANRKQRRNTYIRIKNHLRWGGEIVDCVYVADDIINDSEFVKKLVDSTLKPLCKKFKIELECVKTYISKDSECVFSIYDVSVIKMIFKKRKKRNLQD